MGREFDQVTMERIADNERKRKALDERKGLTDGQPIRKIVHKISSQVQIARDLKGEGGRSGKGGEGGISD